MPRQSEDKLLWYKSYVESKNNHAAIRYEKFRREPRGLSPSSFIISIFHQHYFC